MAVKQITGKDCCQCCVAELTGLPLKEVYKIMGHCWEAGLSEIEAALSILKIKHDKHRKFENKLPKVGFLFVPLKDNNHCVLLKNNKVFDPHSGRQFNRLTVNPIYFIEVLDECHSLRAQT